MTDLDARIAAGREKKARAFARALWDGWDDVDRIGVGLTKLRLEGPGFWRELAAAIGKREPSDETRALILAKLQVATDLERAKPSS